LEPSQFQLIVLALSGLASLVSLLGTFGVIIYTFAVVRTEVGFLKGKVIEFEGHVRDERRHFNTLAFDEFEKRMDERFTSLEEKVDKVEHKVDKLIESGSAE
jgi:hypothetical protein